MPDSAHPEPGSQLLRIQVQPNQAGRRLDHLLQHHLPEFSRSRLQDWIRDGRVRVNGEPRRPSYTLRGDETILVDPAQPPPLHAEPEAIPLTILYEDADVVAVDKPAGMVVHAGAGIRSGTLVNALLHRFGALSEVAGQQRPGIVHRLDRFTSGVLLVARNDAAHRALAAQFSSRQVEKIYLALVHGLMKTDRGRIESPIARDPVKRVKMTARLSSGRAAWSEWTVLRRFTHFSFLEVKIGTGRTHQIRVHLSSIGHPVAGDTLYGAPATVQGLPPLNRYFLHARRIRFHQPTTNAPITIESPLPPDLSDWMRQLP